MKNQLIGAILVFALALLVVPGTMASFTIVANPSSTTQTAGAVFTGGSLNVTNTGNTTISISSLNWTANSSDLTVGFTSASTFDLAPSASKSVGLLVSVGSSITPGTYGITFNGNDNTSSSASGVMQVVIPSAPVTNTGFHFGNGSSINLGGNNQIRDQQLTGTIHVNNDQNTSITNFAVHFTGNAEYNFQITSTVPSTIAPHQQFDLQYVMTVPKDADSQSVKIGSIAYTTSTITGYTDVYMQARSMLTIDDVNFQSDSGNDNSINAGDTINVNVKPGDSASLIVYARNLFPTNNQVDINNVQVTATIYSIDNGDDLVLDSNNFDVRYNNRQKETLDFTVPSSASEDTYQVLIEVSGEDDNGASHYASETIYLKVKRNSHDLRLSNVQFTPLSVCQGATATLSATTTNYGTSSEDAARITVQGSNVNYAQGQNFVIDNYNSGDDTQTSTFNVPTAGLQPGSYNYQVNVYYDGSNFEDAKTANLVVQDCSNQGSSGTASNQTNQPPVIVVQPPTTTSGQGTTTATTTTGTSTSTNTILYTILLIAGNVLIVVLIIWALARLLTR